MAVLPAAEVAALGLDRGVAWSTGTAITDYIARVHAPLVRTKTRTWRNSVMGCLSCNARGLWAREQVVIDGKQRYVWALARDAPSGDDDDDEGEGDGEGEGGDASSDAGGGGGGDSRPRARKRARR